MAKNRGIRCLLACGVTALCFGLGFGLAPALAAPADEQVSVQDDAPYTVQRRMLDGPFGSTSSMMREEKTSVSKGVAYSDLDLSRDPDVILLKARAKAAAVDVCREANRRAGSPLYLADERAPGCVADAQKQALANVNRIVADARSARTLARN
jgi:UrcA family protein